MDTMFATLKLGSDGDASMTGGPAGGEVAISGGKVKVAGVTTTLAKILNELIDILVEHTHPTGTGPSGPPMPPATAKLALLQSLKIDGNLE